MNWSTERSKHCPLERKGSAGMGVVQTHLDRAVQSRRVTTQWAASKESSLLPLNFFYLNINRNNQFGNYINNWFFAHEGIFRVLNKFQQT